MGYTRYWKIKKQLDTERFKEYSETCRIVCQEWEKILIEYYLSEGNSLELAEHKSKICGWDGRGEPVFSDTKISFNGSISDDDRLSDLSHETFCISLFDKEFNFCKTARKPYDKQVIACLYLLTKFFGDDVEVSSDGDNSDSEIISFLVSYLRDNKLETLIKE
jgi:hypothetical protein